MAVQHPHLSAGGDPWRCIKSSAAAVALCLQVAAAGEARLRAHTSLIRSEMKRGG